MFRNEAFLTSVSQKILLELFRMDREVVKTSLLSVVRNAYSLERHLHELKDKGLIEIREEKIVRRTFYVSLTALGSRVASQLLQVKESMAPMGTDSYEMPEDFGKEFEGLSAMTHLNVLDDHIAITEHNYDGSGRDRVVMVYVKVNGRGFMRLWCELDNSYDCRHTRYAWTLPSVQEMVQVQKEKGNMKEQK
jgi:hypothetical protein